MKNFQFKLADGKPLLVRKATVKDNRETAKILNSIVREKKYTMCLSLISKEEEKIFIKNLDKTGKTGLKKLVDLKNRLR